ADRARARRRGHDGQLAAPGRADPRRRVRGHHRRAPRGRGGRAGGGLAATRARANAAVTAALSGRAVRQAFRRPQFLAPLVIFPSLMLAINTGGANRATQLPGFPPVHGFLDFELAGAMMQSTMLAGVSAAIALALDFEMGFIDRLFAAPISRYSIVAGRLAATAVLGLLTGLWFLAIGLIFGAHIEGGVPGALAILALTCAAAGAFGTLGAAL